MATVRARNGRQSKTPDHRSDLKVPVVYFDSVECPSVPDYGTRIKVGESGNHQRRRDDHGKSKFGVEFKVNHLCVVRGTRPDEQHVLRYFERHLVPNEVETFWPDEELLGYIRWLRDQYYVWVPDCEQCAAIEELDAVDSSQWMPGPARCKSPPQQKGLFNDFGTLRLPPREVTIDDFYTGETIINAARAAMGAIDLDPASHAYANSVVKALRFYTIADDGLAHDWTGRVWVNPPFSQWGDWAEKIVAEWHRGQIAAMCVLCATRTLTAQYFSVIHENCTAICVLRGRIPFWGNRASTPDDGHAVFYFGSEPERFATAFGEIGKVYRA